MIGYLKGTVISKRSPEVWLDVNGVGYRVRVGDKVWREAEAGQEMAWFIHTAVREDAITLYGFPDEESLQLYELLITVSGVGPKTGISITGSRSVESIEKAVREADVEFFQSIPGIGKKSAQRIIVDLKGKIGSLKEMDFADGGEEDAVYMALKQFGFKPNEIQIAIKDIDRTLSDQQQIKEGLKRLSQGIHIK